MRLPTIKSTPDKWYSQGLSFSCTQCGNCCTGPSGYVWVSVAELHRLATHLRKSAEDVLVEYCRLIGERVSLKERRNLRGEYDCIFLREHPGPDGRLDPAKLGRRTCAIYEVRPLQCRTWPFWDGNLSSRRAWQEASEGCPGMGRGRSYPFDRIEALRTAEDWPDNPPTSDPSATKD